MHPREPANVDVDLGVDRRALDRARTSRDPRFDGKFFIAVTSTGIYCRPICPAPSPKNANVRYYPTAAAAAEAGFRPCLRCRPEAAPGTPAWLGTSAVVRRALRLIQEGALDEGAVASLAARLGVGPRHLHRLFVQHVGASPIVVAQTRRLHFAKRLLDETELPMTQIALAAGFGSLRRFNDTFQKTYRRAPSDIRRHRRGGTIASDEREVVLRLAFRPPYDWAEVRRSLAARALPGVERVDERGYARTVATDGGHTIARVRPLDGVDALELSLRGAPPAALFLLSSAARRAFDLTADPARIALAFQNDPLLGPLVRLRPGVRIVAAWDPFEGAVRALLDPSELARLVARAGRPIDGGGDGLTHLFPSPEALASAGGRVGALARAVADGRIDLGAPVEDVGAALATLPGLDVRTLQDILLRALGDPDAFPAGDPALRRVAADGRTPMSTRALEARADSWRPWRGYAAFHLWSAHVRKRPLLARRRA